MEKHFIEEDIKVSCVTAESFPDGVLAAHQKLHGMIPFTLERKYFGISRPDQGGAIVYIAAVSELETGEAEKLGLESFTIKKGTYVAKTIKDYMNDLSSIGNAFQELLADPEIDHDNGYCLEWYMNDTDVRCMVPLKS